MGPEKKAIGVNLVIYFLFALIAVVLLTRTAVAANAINRDVAQAIQPATGGINESTSNLTQLDTTVDVTSQIQAAAEPLSGHLDGVVAATERIDSNLASTDVHVKSIDNAVTEIKASTGKIKPEVDELGDTVESIHDNAEGIDKGLNGVYKETNSIYKNLGGAQKSLQSVLDDASPLLATVKSILATALEINKHTDSIDSATILLSPTLP